MALLSIDLGYRDLSRQMNLHDFLPVIVTTHVLVIAAHIVSIVGSRPRRVAALAG